MSRSTNRLTLGLGLGLWLMLAPPAVFAAPVAPRAQEAGFLVPGSIDAQALLPAPPAADSLVERAELEVLLHLQEERTPAQVARARLVEDEDVFGFGADVLGPWFSAINLPRTAEFFAKVREDFLPLNRAAKALFKRRRPPYLDGRIRPCVPFADTGAYPSGHGMQSALWARLLGAIFPDETAALARRAAETRWCRLLAGVHHPSDVEAGRILGEALARELLKSPAVQAALKEIRIEAAAHQR